MNNGASRLVDDDFEIGLRFGFLERALTEQSIREGVLEPHQFVEIKDLKVNPDTNAVHIHCSIHEYLMN